MLGRLDEAEAVLGWLEERGRALARASALAAAARCRGLLAAAGGDADAAIAAFENALREHDRVTMPFERARTLLALGRNTAAGKQKRAARESLGAALAILEELGAAPLGRESIRRARPDQREELPRAATPTEMRVAALVAEGRTNKEVAAELFVTDRTVEYHLSHSTRSSGSARAPSLARRFPGSPGPNPGGFRVSGRAQCA